VDQVNPKQKIDEETECEHRLATCLTNFRIAHSSDWRFPGYLEVLFITRSSIDHIQADYQSAWEIATREWAFLPDEQDQPQLSFDPATLNLHQPLPTTSA
jgi:hypothetical protein